MSKKNIVLRRHKDRQCPSCWQIKEDYRPQKIFVSFRALTCHLRINHTLTEKEIKKIKQIYKKYKEGDSFLFLCAKEGLIY